MKKLYQTSARGITTFLSMMLFFCACGTGDKHLLQEKTYIDNTIRTFEKHGVHLFPAFVTGVEGHVLVRDWLIKEEIDLLVNMMGFGLVGGGDENMMKGHVVAGRQLVKLTVVADNGPNVDGQ